MSYIITFIRVQKVYTNTTNDTNDNKNLNKLKEMAFKNKIEYIITTIPRIDTIHPTPYNIQSQILIYISQ